MNEKCNKDTICASILYKEARDIIKDCDECKIDGTEIVPYCGLKKVQNNL